MTRTLPLIALAAAALAGCDNNDHTIVAGPNLSDPMANAVQNLEDVRLPPSISASHVYRCKDNSVVYVDWLSDDSARIKSVRTEIGTTVTLGEDGTYAGDGQTLSGTQADQTVTINGQSCKR